MPIRVAQYSPCAFGADEANAPEYLTMAMYFVIGFPMMGRANAQNRAEIGRVSVAILFGNHRNL
jgi:hypothetical protein